MKILLEHHKYRAYSPDVIGSGGQQACNLYARGLRNAGHQVTCLVPGNPTGANDVTVAAQSNWYETLDTLAHEHDVVLINSMPMPGIFSWPKFIKKTLFIDNGASGQSTNNTMISGIRDRVKLLGGTFITVDVDSPLDSHHSGYINNQCVTPDRAEFIEHDPKLLIAIGRNIYSKQLQLAADIMKELEQHGYYGVIYSDDYSIQHRDVRNTAPHAEIMRWLARSACLLQTSMVEGNGGRVTFEAAQHGVPVLHYIKNADYFLIPSSTSVKVDPTVDSFVQAVLNLEQPDRIKARAWFDKNYSEAQFVERLVTWLEIIRRKERING